MGSKSLLAEVKKNKRLFHLLVASGLLGGLTAIAQAGYLAGIVDGAFLGGLGVRDLKPGLYMLVLIMVMRSLFIWFTEMLGFRLAARIKSDLRRRLVGHLFELGPVYAAKEQTGELAGTLVEGIENLEAYFVRYLPQLITAVLLPPVILAVVFSLDLTATIIMLVTAPLIPFFMMLIGHWAKVLQRRQWDVLSRLSGHFLDVLQGLSTLKIFNRSKEQAAVILRFSEQFRDTTLSVLKVAFLSALALELLATISTALVAVTIGLKLLYGKLVFRQAFFILLLAPEYYLPLRLLGTHFHAGMAGATAAERIFDILAEPAPGGTSGKRPFSAPEQIGVKFEDVTYSYPGRERPALNDVSFCLEPGRRLALVGASGAGKSTVAQLLLGFIKPDSGRITINGEALGELRRSEWLANVAYVPQQPYLFYGTVADNIRFGSKDRFDDLAEAAKEAGAHDFILGLPEGYETIIGEGGWGLSGGEAQRIAIARAFFKKTSFLILDEATTRLDPENENIVQEALERLMAGKTVLLIAHRLTTVTHSDHILVLDQGEIIESGGHKELLDRQGTYYRLVTAYRGAV